MSGRYGKLRGTVCVVAVVSVLAGCGGGGTASTGSPTDGSGDTPSAQIQGVDTPSSVSVVTATNAD